MKDVSKIAAYLFVVALLLAIFVRLNQLEEQTATQNSCLAMLQEGLGALKNYNDCVNTINRYRGMK